MMIKKDKCSLLLENGSHEVLMQLRDNVPDIASPDCLSTFGGAIESGETPEQAMIREMYEETRYKLKDFSYECAIRYDGYNIYLFRKVDKSLKLEDLQVVEGQKGVWVSKDNIDKLPYKFGFCFRKVLLEYFKKYH
jgi:8-oxo-dGTP pyrophosphatase MutT (NUDIX family)